MPPDRFFVDKKLTDPSVIDLDASDLWRIVRITGHEGLFRVEHITFDFSISIVGPRHACNRIHTSVDVKDSIDGLVANVLKPGERCREVDQAQFDAIAARLREKSDYMRSRKRRRQVVTESKEQDSRPRLP